MKHLWIVLFAGLLAGVAIGQEPAGKNGFAGTKAGQEWSDNGLKMKFCWCPPGKFTMGSPKVEEGRNAGEDQVRVTLTRGFWLGKYTVTQGEWQRIMGTTLREQRDKKGKEYEVHGEGASYPMYYVNHDEATEFCRKLTGQERRTGKLPAGWEYSLPTEAQWEYACRAGETARFSFGEEDSDLGKYGWYAKNSKDTMHEVGQKRPNAWGLHDMHGNVCQWCRDWYAETLPGGTDPEVRDRATRFVGRVSRGSSWDAPVHFCRSAARFEFQPYYRVLGGSGGSDLGFRVALGQSR